MNCSWNTLPGSENSITMCQNSWSLIAPGSSAASADKRVWSSELTTAVNMMASVMKLRSGCFLLRQTALILASL